MLLEIQTIDIKIQYQTINGLFLHGRHQFPVILSDAITKTGQNFLLVFVKVKSQYTMSTHRLHVFDY